MGCGTIGPSHLAAYAGTQRAELVGVADVVEERAAALAERFGPTRSYASAEHLLREHRPDIVSVATPPGTHAELAEEILAAGCSVLLEKPPCLTLSQLDHLLRQEASSDGQIYVVFQHRHGSGARRAHRLLGEGALGHPNVFTCETLWFRPESYFEPEWRGTWSGEGGGPTLGHGIHQFDLLLHLLGPWREITALTARRARPVEFEDVSLGLVVLESGAVGTVVNSLLSPRELSRLRIDLTGGTLEVDHVYGHSDADWSFTPSPDPQEAAVLGRDPGVRDATGAVREVRPRSTGDGDPWTASAGDDVPSNHAAQISRLVDDLLDGRTHDTTLASTRSTMALVAGLYASALQGAPVRCGDLGPGNPFYDDLSGGVSQQAITARMLT